MNVSTRCLLAAVGAGAGSLVLRPAFATDAAGSATVIDEADRVSAVAASATPQVAYDLIDATAFSPLGPGGVVVGPYGVRPTATPSAMAVPLGLPVGARLVELTVSYLNLAAPMEIVLYASTFGASSVEVTEAAMPPGPDVLAVTLTPEGVVADTTRTFMALVGFNQDSQFLQGARVGYVPLAASPPTPAFTASSPIARVLDTRIVGAKLRAGEERVVALGVPGSATAAVINLTVTDTEAAGFVAVFPANDTYPGNSSINWSAPAQTVANTVVTAVDAQGQMKIRGGVDATHVVIDVQGYLR